MQNQIGNYLYFDGMKHEKTFGDRKFIILIAAAKDAGIIGPEDNGIAILDANYKTVILDQHLKAHSGYDGPSREQIAGLKQIVEMDWCTFSHFVATHPNYRGVAFDINNVEDPDAGDHLDQWIATGKVDGVTGPDIRTANMINAEGYSFPAKSREEMIVELANHDAYHPMNSWNGGFVVSWNIKVRGKISASAVEGYEFDGQFDERWDALLEEEGNEIFEEAASSALSTYLEGYYTPYGAEDVKAKFFTNGRSGGHLVLSEWNGPKAGGWANFPMAFDSRADYTDWLKSLRDEELVKFYALVRTVDQDTSDPTMAMNHQYAFIREMREVDWAAEAAPTI
jgi:hypothetical protein